MATVLHLPFDAPILPDARCVSDVSPVHHECRLIGAAELSSVKSAFGSRSLRLNGSAGCLQVAKGSEQLRFGTKPFTVQARVYLDGLPGVQGGQVFGSQEYGTASDYVIFIDYSGRLCIYVSSNNTAYYSTGVVGINLWAHLAVVHNGASLILFINGIGTYLTISPSLSFNTGYAGCYSAGADNDGDEAKLSGYIDELIVDDTALWSANFTPPSAQAYSYQLGVTPVDTETTLSAFPVPAQHLYAPQRIRSLDTEFGGNGKIVGTTMNTPALPVSRRVRLHDSRSGMVVREAWSDTAGNYSFTNIRRDYTYYVVGFDHTDAYQGVVADKLVPEAM